MTKAPSEDAASFDDNSLDHTNQALDDYEDHELEALWKADEEDEIEAENEYEQWLHDQQYFASLPDHRPDVPDHLGALAKAIADAAGITALPHVSDVSDPVFIGLRPLASAARAIAAALDAREGLSLPTVGEAQRQKLAEELGSRAVEAATHFARLQSAPLVEGYTQLRAAYEREKQAARARAHAASSKVERHDWKEKANGLWATHPTWSTHRIACAIAGPGEEVRSISRAIGKLAPPTSPSWKPT